MSSIIIASMRTNSDSRSDLSAFVGKIQTFMKEQETQKVKHYEFNFARGVPFSNAANTDGRGEIPRRFLWEKLSGGAALDFVLFARPGTERSHLRKERAIQRDDGDEFYQEGTEDAENVFQEPQRAERQTGGNNQRNGPTGDNGRRQFSC